MNIIAGKHKGRRLATLSGRQTRPTGGRVREAIFSILGDFVEEAVVLDLFAGTGAIGLEAISRGASKAVFVDNDRKGIDTIRKNIAACKEQDRAIVIYSDIASHLNLFPAGIFSYDLVFMDPPYNQQKIEPTLSNLIGLNVLSKGAIVIIEHDKKETLPGNPPGLEVIDRRQYGKSRITFLKNH